MRYVGKSGISCRVDQVVEQVVLLHGIGFKVVAQSKIENETSIDLEFVLNIRRQIGVAHVAGRIVPVGRNSHKHKGLILKKCLE